MNTLQPMPTHSNRPTETGGWQVTRLDFLKASGLVTAGLALGVPFARADKTGRPARLRFGIVTDAHFADANARGARHYRESIAKMTECVTLMNEQKVDFLIELGDFKDEGKPAREEDTLKFLETIEGVFKQFKGPRYHVLGNHDVDSISKTQFLAGIENTGIDSASTYYSFDAGGVHVVVLDADYKTDGSDYDHGNFNWTDANIPPAELNWLAKDLATTSKPVLAFVHQQLDGKGSHYIRNAVNVRRTLQKGGNVLAVFQGHNHAGHYSRIENVHYYTLKAMVDGSGEGNNSHAIVEVDTAGNIVVNGYRRAVSREMKRT